MYEGISQNILPAMSLAGVEVGTHFYWDIGGAKLHGQVFLVSWLASGAILLMAILGTRTLQRIPEGLQNFAEFVFEFV
jgi:F-type H+-transporting ATPase subunit a